MAIALDATATVTDSGIISYDWYSNTTNSNTGGTKLNVTTATYTPLTTTAGTTYYYCVVTNTNSAATGTKTAQTTSAVANIKVEATPVDKGWEIDASGNLTISTADGMTDWKANGRDANKDSVKTALIAEAVTYIPENAFNDFPVLTDVTASGATSIGQYAFAYCDNLAKVEFPKVETIGQNAFQSCSQLVTVEFLKTEKIGVRAFWGCTELTSASFPKATAISGNMFTACTALTSVSFPETTTIAGYAFWDCTELTSASFPQATTIGEYAFRDCKALATLKLGATPPTVDADAFSGCPDTRALAFVDGSEKPLTDEALTKAQTAYKAEPDGSAADNFWYGWDIGEPVADKGWTIDTSGNLTITSATGMTDWVENGLDANKDTVKTVTIENTVTEIPKEAFYYCKQLEEVTAPGVTDIGESAFESCTVLTSVTANGTTSIGNGAFYRCAALTSASFPKVTTIGAFAFQNCTKLATLSLPAAPPKVMDAYAFQGCPATRALVLVDADGTALTDDALTAAQGNYKVAADGSATDNFWYGWTINEVTLTTIAVTTQPTKTTYIAGESFDKTGMVITAAYSDSSTVVVTDYSVSPSGALAASNTTITISYTKDGITKSADVTITVNDKVNAVAPIISTDLSETEVIYTKDTVVPALRISAETSDGGKLSYEWYSNTTNSTTGGTKLTGTAAIYTPSTAGTGTTYYYCIVTNTITDNGDGGTKTATATSAVANIKVEAAPVDKGWAIDASGNLTISTDAGMTDWVANGLATNKDTVKTATIAETVTEIPIEAFKKCSVLTNVTANGATNIAISAFYDCIALTSASFPAAKTIGLYSFRGCEALTSASFPAAETIGDSAFRVCKALTSTSFPAAETIDNSAFSGCTALTSASFPKVETIGESAFYGCTALTSANFPVAETIGKAAFYDCSKLATLKLPAAPPSAPVASTFGNCPATRALALVNADGTALTGDALTNAQAAYKAVNDGDATDTLWYGWKIDVAPPTTPTVTSVAVTPETASVQQGNTQQFAAAVTGTNSPAQTVTWKVTGGKTGTSISTGGLLTVASDETAATLAVTATSTVDTTKSGTATVTVTSTPVTKYTLTVTNGTGGGSYEAGASVTATANAAPSNQHFKEWTATGLTGVMLTDSPLTFQMPAGTVTLTAVYEADPPVVTVDKSALITAIANAKSIMANTVISVQGGADVSTSTYWVLPDIMSAAKSALSEAEAIVAKADGTQAEVDNATVKLNAKVNIDFKNAKKAGTKSSGNGGGSGSGGGSSSGGSGSGGSSSGTTPSPSQPVVKIPGTGQATIPATVDQNGNVNVSVTDKNITDAITDAKKDVVQGQPITVEIKVNTDKDASQLTTTLPQSVRDALINNQVGSLTIGNKDVSINFSQAVLLQMNAQAQGNLTITVAKADTGNLMGNAQTLIGNHPTYEFKATCDGRIITDLGQNAVTITISYILKEGETAANIQAIRVDANGVATVIPGSFYDVTKQAVVFTTGQISAIYGIGYRQTTASSIHTVQRSETLAIIAKRYQTTVQAIAAINGILNLDQIEIGQEIQIPQ